MSCPHSTEIDTILPKFTNLQVSSLCIPNDLAEDLPYEEQVQYLGDVVVQDLPVELTQLWKQFLMDILQSVEICTVQGLRPHIVVSPRRKDRTLCRR